MQEHRRESEDDYQSFLALPPCAACAVAPMCLVSLDLDVKSWTQRPPSVEAARPSRCPACDVGSRSDGIVVQGHGLRVRDVITVDGPVELRLRRYRCRHCGHTMTVAPWPLVSRRRYTAVAIAYALALWAWFEQTAATVRSALRPGQRIGDGTLGDWPVLRRWARTTGRIFGECCPNAPEVTPRSAARRVVHWLRSFVPPDCGSAEPATAIALGVRRVVF